MDGHDTIKTVIVKTIVKEDGKVPEYKTPGSAGADLCAAEDYILNPRETALINTNVIVEIPQGYELQIRPRSGLAYKNHVTVLNSPGTIDSDYRNTIGVILINHGDEYFKISKGDRIAQAVLSKVEIAQFIEAKELSDTERGEGGFGSTGVK